MKLAVGVEIFEQAIFIFVIHSHLCIFFFYKVVGVDKIAARIIRRVNVDHLDLAEITLLQKLEDFQIVALNVEIFRGVPITAVLFHRAQGLGDRPRRFHHGRLFAPHVNS